MIRTNFMGERYTDLTFHQYWGNCHSVQSPLTQPIVYPYEVTIARKVD